MPLIEKNLTGTLSCFYVTFTKFLNYHGIDLEEEDVFFLCSGFTPVKVMDSMNKDNPLDFGYQSYQSLIMNLGEALEILINIVYPDKLSEKFNERLLNNNILLMLVDSKILNHHYINSIVENYHFLLSVGFERTLRKVNIEDYYVMHAKSFDNYSTFKVSYDLDIIKSALCGVAYIDEIYSIKNIYKEKIISNAINGYRLFIKNSEDNILYGNSIFENIFNCFEETVNRGINITQNQILNFIINVQARHLSIFTYSNKFINKYLENDHMMLTDKIISVEKLWKELFTKMIINIHAYNPLRSKAIIKDARIIFTKQNEIFAELINKISIQYNGL